MISLIIPTNGTNKEYTDFLIQNIRKIYPDESKVEIILEENSEVTLGHNYNTAVSKAKGDKIILLHNDMYVSKGFIESMDLHICKNRIVTYTRIEPPIYRDEYPGKKIIDCGNDLKSFDEDKFNSLNFTGPLLDGGSQLFFGCMKEDYIGIDGRTFKMFCEDDDLHLRYSLLGFERKVSPSFVYHFVSKTSRSGDYRNIEYNSNRNFIRKWGFRKSIHNKKYNIAFVIKKCNEQLLDLLEPWCDRIYIEDDMQVITDSYIHKEQPNTAFDLKKRVFNLKNNYPIGENDVVIEFDGTKLSEQSFNIIQNLSDIIAESGEEGEFELDIFKIHINTLVNYENNNLYFL
jgi:GT2 family glycosyltransferase